MLRDGERLAAPRQADPEPVGRAQRLQVELDGGVSDLRRRVRVDLQLGVVGGRGDQRARPQEVVQERLRQRRPLGRIRPGTQLVEQHERARTGRLRDSDDRAEVARERRERLRHGLLVADVREHVAQDREPGSGIGRHVEAGLVHEGEQAEGPQRDRLAARVRAGHQERLEVRAELHVDGNDPPGQPGMAGSLEDDLGAGPDLGTGCVHLLGEARLRAPQVETGQRAEQLEERP